MQTDSHPVTFAAAFERWVDQLDAIATHAEQLLPLAACSEDMATVLEVARFAGTAAHANWLHHALSWQLIEDLRLAIGEVESLERVSVARPPAQPEPALPDLGPDGTGPADLARLLLGWVETVRDWHEILTLGGHWANLLAVHLSAWAPTIEADFGRIQAVADGVAPLARLRCGGQA
jgi:hypothetical protein